MKGQKFLKIACFFCSEAEIPRLLFLLYQVCNSPLNEYAEDTVLCY